MTIQAGLEEKALVGRTLSEETEQQVAVPIPWALRALFRVRPLPSLRPLE